jgi:hypothetical protein
MSPLLVLMLQKDDAAKSSIEGVRGKSLETGGKAAVAGWEPPPRTVAAVAAAREETVLTTARMRAVLERRPHGWSNGRDGIGGKDAVRLHVKLWPLRRGSTASGMVVLASPPELLLSPDLTGGRLSCIPSWSGALFLEARGGDGQGKRRWWWFSYSSPATCSSPAMASSTTCSPQSATPPVTTVAGRPPR